ncbi:MAG: TetR/AcrR family transcriptional regulator [Pseudomonadota bacterium]
MPASQPRKLPSQRRSRATVEAILDAAAEALIRHGYAGATTSVVAQRAGVSVGTLYQYFPNRDAVGAALVLRAMERIRADMRKAFAECVTRRLEGQEGTEHLLLTGLEVLVAERAVFARLGAEAPHLFANAAVRGIQAELIQLSEEIRQASGDGLDLNQPEADAWIIGHMVSASMLQISLLDDADQRRALTREVARLTCRMALGSDVATSRRPAAA